MTAYAPRPEDVAPDDLDDPFWAGCRRGDFLLHRCDECGRHYWPASTCVEHGAVAMTWVPGSGRGVVHTWTVFHRVYAPHLAERVPYVIAVVRLDEGPFFHTDLADCPPGQVTSGMPVEVRFDASAPGTPIPRFAPLARPDGPRAPQRP